MKTRLTLRGAAIGLGCLAVLSSPWWGVRALRHVAWFEVHRVEVSGTRLLAPHEVLSSAAVRPGQTIWDDPSGWESALRAHPAIAEARVTRRLPGTLRVRIVEKQPVAFLEAGGLHPVSAAGELLPIDPVGAPVDLPILRAASGRSAAELVADASVARLVAELGRLRQADPELVARISEVRRGEGAMRLILSRPDAEILLPEGVPESRLRELRAVLADLERRAEVPGGPGSARVDVRFADQIVVRLLSV